MADAKEKKWHPPTKPGFSTGIPKKREAARPLVAGVMRRHVVHTIPQLKRLLVKEHNFSMSIETLKHVVADINAGKNPITKRYEVMDWRLSRDELWWELGYAVRAVVHQSFLTTGGEVVMVTDQGVAERVALIIDGIRAEGVTTAEGIGPDAIAAVTGLRNTVVVYFQGKPPAETFSARVQGLLSGGDDEF